MTTIIKLKKYLPDSFYNPLLEVYNRHLNRFYQKSYAQEGEDIVLQRFLSGREKGFYVDIGAHHPKRFSNTYLYYKKGWKGINIEPRPGSKKIFDKIRPRDINLELAVNSKEEELTYYIFNESALNGFSKNISEERNELSNYHIIDEIKITTLPLKKILERFLPAKQNIDFLSIDVEGLDFEVLESNDWEKYKPNIVLVEDREFQVLNPLNSKVFGFLSRKGYQLVGKTFNTLLFRVAN